MNNNNIGNNTKITALSERQVKMKNMLKTVCMTSFTKIQTNNNNDV